tara:strand:+ start:296 stop:1627 length:1332 start_codon:yes stop_codon:yes gene_type:complete
MASTYIYRASGTPTSTRKFTFSFWVKKSGQGADQFIVSSFTDANNRLHCAFDSNDRFDFIAKVSGSNIIRTNPDMLFRDSTAWYHIVLNVDTTQSTAADRSKVYVNGVEQTEFGSGNKSNPSQNADVNISGDHFIGAYDNSGSPSLFLDGCLAHVHYTDGYTYAASTFGETDSTSGIWKPKTAPSVTYGTNGFFLKFQNSGNLDLDSSGNNLSFTTAGTLTQNIDTPDNNFATLNPLTLLVSDSFSSVTTGNLTALTTSGSNWGTILSTLGDSSGKYYFEAKLISSGSNCIIGAVDINNQRQNDDSQWYIGQDSTGQGYQNNGAASNGGASYGATYANGDIIGCAMDLDNNKLYFSKNGVFQNSGVPTSGSTGTGAMSLTADTTYAFALTGYAGTNWNANFGQGYFGTTQVASAGTAPSGGGIFEYDCPTGYQALCTKGINSF